MKTANDLRQEYVNDTGNPPVYDLEDNVWLERKYIIVYIKWLEELNLITSNEQ